MISNDMQYIGVNDYTTDLFEGQYDVPSGMSYNSYVITDEKIAVFDTADALFVKEWLDNLKEALGDRTPDYLIVSHMEPDHSAGIDAFVKTFPQATIVSSDKAFAMMKKYFDADYVDHRLVVKDGDTLSLGAHTLTFITAPMVHWPEVIMTYDAKDKVLFSADGFGKFGALDAEEDWIDEAARYYFGIVGKYGAQVQAVLKKAAALDIEAICPLHGPVLTDNLGYYLDLYNTWSSYQPENDGVLIAYTSVYGHTAEAAEQLADLLTERGCDTVACFDLARCDVFEAISQAFRCGKLVLATTTYNADIFPFMHTFLHGLVERGFKNRTVGIIENGSWAPTAAKVIKKQLESCKDLTFTDTTVTVHAVLDEQSGAALRALADELV